MAAPPSPVAVSSGLWQAAPSRARPHRLDVASSSTSARSEWSIDLNDAPDGDRVVLDMRDEGGGERRDGLDGMGMGALNAAAGAGGQGERFLLISGVPKEASNDDLKDAFRNCGEVKAICMRFQQRDGVVILAFYDSRHTERAECMVTTNTYFGNLRLRASRLSTSSLRKLMGDSPFIDEMEGEVFVTAEGSRFDPDALKSIVKSFGDLRTFNQASMPNRQVAHTL
ncbi:hypothetical protein DFH11DRAFT_444222 [Phellopilus nigrolimitatus]|nr:hypothetical protein DFH11DRAFT_444222 [Phellopilus nigrolimitatus]